MILCVKRLRYDLRNMSPIQSPYSFIPNAFYLYILYKGLFVLAAVWYSEVNNTDIHVFLL